MKFLQIKDYFKILQFTGIYVDVLIFMAILAVFIIYIRPSSQHAAFVLQIVRSPDGMTGRHTIGCMSIQRAALCILEQYYKDFGVYNPWLETPGAGRKQANKMDAKAKVTVDNENFENEKLVVLYFFLEFLM